MSDDNNATGSEHSNSMGEQFMLAQFSEMNQDWRHYDQRIEAALNIYAAAWALLSAGVIAIYNSTPDLQFLLKTSGLPAFGLYALGFFTARRVINSTISRARRRAAINRAQDFFTKRAPHISPYLPILGSMPKPLKSILVEEQHRGESFEVSFPDGIVRFIIVLNSLLVGLVVASTASFLTYAQRFWWLYILVVVATLVERLFAYQRRKSHFLQKKK